MKDNGKNKKNFSKNNNKLYFKRFTKSFNLVKAKLNSMKKNIH